MADTGPVWALVGAFGGGIVSQLLNAVLTSRRDRSAELRAAFDKLAADSRASHADLRERMAGLESRVAGLAGLMDGFVIGPASRGEPPPGPPRRR